MMIIEAFISIVRDSSGKEKLNPLEVKSHKDGRIWNKTTYHLLGNVSYLLG
jgi:hypothetical protein